MSTPLRSRRSATAAVVLSFTLVAAACGDDDPAGTVTADTTTETTIDASTAESTTATDTETTTAESTAPASTAASTADNTAPATTVATTPESTAEAEPAADAATTVRESGLAVTVQAAGDHTVHTVVSPEQAFANATHIVETNNALVLFDTQVLLPNALDFRAYADTLGTPIEAVFITHAHPDHFLGSEAFADLPVFALAEVADAIAANGDAEVAEKQGEFGPDLIASTYVIPEVVEPGTMEIDGVAFELASVVDAEAEVQLVVRVADAGAVVTGDIIYSGVHLILAGPPDTWTAAIDDLAADAADHPVVLPGHGNATDPSVYDANVAWLATAGELLAAATTGDEFKQGLIDAFPDLGMEAAIDFVLPIYFPEG